jgi:succinoglycan biosynthesis protein ExoM
MSTTAQRRAPVGRVLIGIATYERPQELARLLASLERAGCTGPFVDVLVVDNDPAGSAGSCVADSSLKATYVLEPRPGIAAARNRTLDEAGGYDALIFVDDDEWVAESWLTELMAYANSRPVDVVRGPVLSQLPPGTPRWVLRAGFFQRPIHPHGARLARAYTNNTLVRCDAWVAAGRPRFDEEFSFTGGSDAKFFHTLSRHGAVIEYCATACVTEDVPEHRIRIRWLVRRAVRNGIVTARLWLIDYPPSLVCARGLLESLLGLAALPLTIVRGLRGWAGPVNRCLGGVGIVAGVLGLRINEYARKSPPESGDG